MVFTHLPQDFLDGENFYGSEALYQQYEVERGLWRFGIDPTRAGPFWANTACAWSNSPLRRSTPPGMWRPPAGICRFRNWSDRCTRNAYEARSACAGDNRQGRSGWDELNPVPFHAG